MSRLIHWYVCLKLYTISHNNLTFEQCLASKGGLLLRGGEGREGRGSGEEERAKKGKWRGRVLGKGKKGRGGEMKRRGGPCLPTFKNVPPPLSREGQDQNVSVIAYAVIYIQQVQ